MDKVLKFLKDAETYYLATVEALYSNRKSQRCFETTSSKS